MGSGSPYKNRYATSNRITGVTIDGNRVTIGSTDPGFDPLDFQTLGGIVLLGGGTFGRGGVVRDVKITKTGSRPLSSASGWSVGRRAARGETA